MVGMPFAYLSIPAMAFRPLDSLILLLTVPSLETDQGGGMTETDCPCQRQPLQSHPPRRAVPFSPARPEETEQNARVLELPVSRVMRRDW